MKKIVRIIVPIVLSIAIILCLAWYFFVYDCAFTRDMFLGSARFFENKGSHKIAATFYDLAYRQTSDNEDVAIELAQYHIKHGNYTQAEYTLSKAIADGGNKDLYIALCQTYMEQDKILDAISLLDNITNAEIKSELDSLRPAVPTVDAEPGFYSQYISVKLTSEGNTIYATSNGEYPSVENAPYESPIALHDGENTIYAVSVGDDGLVSPMAIFGYTVGGVIEEVKFTDSVMETTIRQILGVDENQVLFTNNLWDITSFTVPEGVENYDDLTRLAFLQDLTIDSASANVVSKISGFSNLVKLTVKNTPVSLDEIEIIGNLPMLQELTLSGCGLSSIVGLENALKITYLDLSKNSIRDLASLASLTEIQRLNLQNNVVADLSPLSAMGGLVELNISYNTLADILPLTGFKNLTTLRAGNNKITSLPSLENLQELAILDLSFNTIADISPVSVLQKMTNLNISNNAISDISSLKALNSLQELDFSHNTVEIIPSWSEECSLISINGSENIIKDVSPLNKLQNLNNIYMDYNEELSDVNILSECPRLVQVNVYGTSVKDATKLISNNVVVNYDPT